MRIAQLASLTESVPPKGYGGTELVIELLTEELVKQGHEVTLFASGDSVTSAELVSVLDSALRLNPDIPHTRWAAYDIRSMLELKKREQEFDVIHNHMGWQALPLLSTFQTPVITTNHNPVKEYCRDIYFAYDKMPIVSISDAYRRLNYPDRLNYVGTVYNGIDLSKYRFDPDSKREYLVFLGRLCHDKGTAESIDIASRLNMPLKIAGKVDVRDREYFEKEVEPRLKAASKDVPIEYIGEVNDSEKEELFRGAIATVYPINFDEPFGLVMAESMACGVPLLALERGSVREVLSDGETAVISKNVDDLVERFPEVEKMDRAVCRKRVEDLFGRERMAAGYLELYNTLIRN